MGIPTSLIVVLLVVAWLAILVPMVARRREKVPEIDESGAGFRVLHRSTPLRRPSLASWAARRRQRDEDVDELDDATDLDEDADLDRADDEENAAEPLHEQLLDEDDEDDLELAESDRGASSDSSTEDVADPAAEVPLREPRTRRQPRPHHGSSPASRRWGGARVAQPDEGMPVHPTAVADAPSSRRAPDTLPEQVEELDEQRYRPVPQRHGRGGYDPEAAEATKAFRYQRRRRVTAILLLATIVFALLAALVKPVLWSVAGLCALLLVGYLAYLRRQVRIEEDIRQRRLAKLRRARQIRPEYHSSQRSVTTDDLRVAESDWAGHTAAMATAPMAGAGRGRRIVDLDDDDPGFDELEYYEPVVYRRASGQ